MGSRPGHSRRAAPSLTTTTPGAAVVSRLEKPRPRTMPNAHRSEQSRRCGLDIQMRVESPGRWIGRRLARIDWLVVEPDRSEQRTPVQGSDRLDARRSGQLLLEQIAPLGPRRQIGNGRRDRYRHQAIRREPQHRVIERLDAPEKHARARQQQKRQRHLRGHDHALQATATGIRRTRASVREYGRGVDAADRKNRPRGAEQDRREDSKRAEGEDSGVEGCDLAQAWHVDRRKLYEHALQSPRDRGGSNDGGKRDEQGLEQHQTDQMGPGGTNRHPDGQGPMSASGTGDLQTRDVGTTHQQQ